MSQWKLQIHTPGKEKVISNPHWKQIQTILDQVDGSRFDNVSLFNDKFGDLMVAGGDQIHGIRRYHVQYYDAVHRYEANLVNPSESEETKEHLNITVQKVGTDIFKQYLVGYDDMIRAVKHFFETGELTEDQEWE